MRNFHNLIVYTVKIYNQCMQTASVFGDSTTDVLSALHAWDSTGNFRSHAAWDIAPQMNILGAHTASRIQYGIGATYARQ